MADPVQPAEQLQAELPLVESADLEQLLELEADLRELSRRGLVAIARPTWTPARFVFLTPAGQRQVRELELAAARILARRL